MFRSSRRIGYPPSTYLNHHVTLTGCQILTLTLQSHRYVYISMRFDERNTTVPVRFSIFLCLELISKKKALMKAGYFDLELPRNPKLLVLLLKNNRHRWGRGDSRRPPLRFFEDSEITTARSAAVFCAPNQESFSHTS